MSESNRNWLTDRRGRRPHWGARATCARLNGITLLSVDAGLRSGRLIVAVDGSIVARDPSVPVPAAPVAAPTAAPASRAWEIKRSAFASLAERLLADRPDSMSAEDAAADLNGQVRTALGSHLRRSSTNE